MEVASAAEVVATEVAMVVVEIRGEEEVVVVADQLAGHSQRHLFGKGKVRDWAAAETAELFSR